MDVRFYALGAHSVSERYCLGHISQKKWLYKQMVEDVIHIRCDQVQLAWYGRDRIIASHILGLGLLSATETGHEPKDVKH
jgi:hypothetical protein